MASHDRSWNINIFRNWRRCIIWVLNGFNFVLPTKLYNPLYMKGMEWNKIIPNSNAHHLEMYGGNDGDNSGPFLLAGINSNPSMDK